MSKEIQLTKGKVALIDDEDFESLSQFNWRCTTAGYAATDTKGVFRKTIMMHRQILGVQKRNIEIDHINRNRLDNRKSNLRISTVSQNQANRPATKNNKSGFKGVYWDKTKKKWRASIRFQSRTYALGSYDNPKDAARAYDKKAIEFFGEFAKTNF